MFSLLTCHLLMFYIFIQRNLPNGLCLYFSFKSRNLSFISMKMPLRSALRTSTYIITQGFFFMQQKKKLTFPQLHTPLFICSMMHAM